MNLDRMFGAAWENIFTRDLKVYGALTTYWHEIKLIGVEILSHIEAFGSNFLVKW